jgi:hypothetical protein
VTADELIQYNEKLIRMLCVACKLVEESCFDQEFSEELSEWWWHRQETDKKIKEDKKQQILNKLTKEERLILGI